MDLTNLHNPDKITGVLIKDVGLVKAGEFQGFQTYPKSVELWEQLIDGRLFRLRRWLSKSIICTYKQLNKEV